MKIRKKCFGGYPGFYLRKYFPKQCSTLYLWMQRKHSNRITKKYIQQFESSNFTPLFVSIETINRCNGTCPFCPCNIHDETRPYKEMSDALFQTVIQKLKEINYDKTLMLLANNEIFLDKKIVSRLQYTKENLPNCKIKIFTNGKLLTPKLFQTLLENDYIDEFIINNYNSTPKLTPPIKKIYDMYKKEEIHTKVTIQLRYANEILSNRANTSPNKKGKKKIKDYCALPYTDLNIGPDGTLLLCCCDATEKTNLGNIKEKDILSLFNSPAYQKVRKKLREGRDHYSFCQYCDFNDIGTRYDLMIEKLKGEDHG